MAEDLSPAQSGSHPDQEEFTGWGHWTRVFAANMMFPFPLGLIYTHDRGGWIGMLLGIVICWGIGTVLCLRPGRLGPVLICGGYIIAITQFFPILQFGAGSVATFTNEWILTRGEFNRPGIEAEIAGFAITLQTAVPLALVAFMFGGGHRLLFVTSSTDS